MDFRQLIINVNSAQEIIGLGLSAIDKSMYTKPNIVTMSSICLYIFNIYYEMNRVFTFDDMYVMPEQISKTGISW